MTRASRRVSVAAAGGVFLVVCAARADNLFGGPGADTGLLVEIVANGLDTLARLNQQLETMEKSYATVKRGVNYVEDGAKMVEDLANGDLNGLRDVLEDALPALHYADNELHNLDSWTHGQGMLGALVRSCVNAKTNEAHARSDQIGDERAWALGKTDRLPSADDQMVKAAKIAADDTCAYVAAELSGDNARRALGTVVGQFDSEPGQFISRLLEMNQVESKRDQVQAAVRAEQIEIFARACLGKPAVGPSSLGGDTVNAGNAKDRCEAAKAGLGIVTAQETQAVARELARIREMEQYKLALDWQVREEQKKADAKQLDEIKKAAVDAYAPRRITFTSDDGAGEAGL